MYIHLFVFGVLLCGVLCQFTESNKFYSYQLPDGRETKSLNVSIDTESHKQFLITIECFDYDSLKYFEVRLYKSQQFELRNGVKLDFTKCFNNATDHGNYNYGLARWFNSLPYYNNGYPFAITFDQNAKVKTEAFFENFDFNKFTTVSLKNLDFTSTTFLNNLYCERCTFQNIGFIDFNDFNNNTLIKTRRLDISYARLKNLIQNNLKKLSQLTQFDISDFELDDMNVFNVPDLFAHNKNITEIKIVRSTQQIILHANVFRGLNRLRIVYLENLQLDVIPKDLFKDLTALQSIQLSLNNIKTLDGTTFQTNERLNSLSLRDNPFHTEQHEKWEAFQYNGERGSFEFGNFTSHTYDLLELLTKNDKVNNVAFQSNLIDKFNFAEFTKIRAERETVLTVIFRAGDPVLDLEYVKSLGNIIRPKYVVRQNVTLVFNMQFAGDAMCYDCTMIRRLFPHFLRLYLKPIGFYFEESHLFIGFIIPEACKRLDERFENTFDENCPSGCVCKYNPLLDKVTIDCSNNNFTEIPHIAYPVQFDNIDSIELNFENNLISVLSLKTLNGDVFSKLSSLNLKNNKIASVQPDEVQLLRNFEVLNLCENPVLESLDNRHNLRLATTYINRKHCFTMVDTFKQAVNYIVSRKLHQVSTYLDALPCA